jgi:methylmalonyl-CoA carboxyltransferase small subunit
MKLKVTVNAVPYEVDVEVAPPELALPAITIGGGSGPAIAVSAPKGGGAPASANAIPAPLAGTVNRILVEKGQEVKEGDVVLILEAMKMETEITTPRSGKVTNILVAQGDPVQGGQGLLEVE